MNRSESTMVALVGTLVGLVLLVGCDGSQPVASTLEAAATYAWRSTLTGPSSPTAVAMSETRIDVSWQDNSTDESGFEVHRSTTGASGVFALLASTAVAVTTYGDVGLTASTQYCYKIRAFRTIGGRTSYSTFSNTVCATTPTPPPAPPLPPPPPSGTNARPASSSAVEITWVDNSTTEYGFRLERSLDGGATWTKAATTAANTIFFFDDGRTSEQQLCYRVIAFTVQGDSPPSNTDCTTPPAGPTNLVATVVNDQTAELTWDDNSAVEDGYILWGGVFGDENAPSDLPANSTHVTIELLAGYVYAFRVAAKKDGGYSDASNEVFFTAPEPGASGSVTSSTRRSKP